MWSENSVQEQVLQYVPLWAVTKTQSKFAARYGVMRGLAFVLAAEIGKPQLVQRGLPFNTAEKSVQWFKGLPAKLQAVADAEKKAATQPESREAKEALADALAAAGLLDQAIAALGEVAEKLPTGSDERIGIEFKRATLARQKFDFELAGKLYESVVPALLEKKDERAVAGVLDWSSILTSARKADKARELLLKAVEIFPKHERKPEMRVRAATCRFSMPTPDYKDIAAELRKIAADGPEDNTWVKSALKTAQALESRAERAKPAEEKKPENTK